MKKLEIIKRAKNENLLLAQTDFFTNGLSADELNEIKGGRKQVHCGQGYSSGDGTTKCECRYRS